MGKEFKLSAGLFLQSPGAGGGQVRAALLQLERQWSLVLWFMAAVTG